MINPILRARWKETLAGALMIIGLILAFFFLELGAFLVGLSFGLMFAHELQDYFIGIRASLNQNGLVKTLIMIGTLLFLLLAITLFIIGVAIGYVGIVLIDWKATHPK